jgi:hypothetical protein
MLPNQSAALKSLMAREQAGRWTAVEIEVR